LSVVGVLPAMLAGLDAALLRQGARRVLEETLAARRPEEAAPALGAALAVGYAEARGIRQSVLMPYVDRLGPLAAWWAQLWAESLGKGGHGMTPIRAHGPVDQHSQLQLYLDGPRDKLFTLIPGRTPVPDRPWPGTGPPISRRGAWATCSRPSSTPPPIPSSAPAVRLASSG